jgi:hypothetical protein
MVSKMRVMAVVAGLLAAFGCASVPKPTGELAASEGALRSAKELGADAIPQAALEIKLAEDEMQKAREQMKNDDNESARQNLLRSRADAELALALTRQGQANSGAQGAQDTLRAVQKSVQ